MNNNRYCRILTTAPSRYDWSNGWSVDAGNVGYYKDLSGKEHAVRQVFVEESRLDSQLARYGSGMFYSWTEKLAEDEVRYGHLNIN